METMSDMKSFDSKIDFNNHFIENLDMRYIDKNDMPLVNKLKNQGFLQPEEIEYVRNVLMDKIIACMELEDAVSDSNSSKEEIKEKQRAFGIAKANVFNTSSEIVNGTFDQEMERKAYTIKSTKTRTHGDRSERAAYLDYMKIQRSENKANTVRQIQQAMRNKEKGSIDEGGHISERRVKLMSDMSVRKFEKWFNCFCASSYKDGVQSTYDRNVLNIKVIIDEYKSHWRYWYHRTLMWYKTEYYNTFTGNELIKSKLCISGDYSFYIDSSGIQRYTKKTIAFIPWRNSVLKIGKWIDLVSEKFKEGKVICIDDNSRNTFIGSIICLTLVRISCGSIDTAAFPEVLILLSKLKELECILFLTFYCSNIRWLSSYINIINGITYVVNEMVVNRFGNQSANYCLGSLEQALIAALTYMSIASDIKKSEDKKPVDSPDIIDVVFSFFGNDQNSDMLNFKFISDTMVLSKKHLPLLCKYLNISRYTDAPMMLYSFDWCKGLSDICDRYEGPTENKKFRVTSSSLIAVLTRNGALREDGMHIFPDNTIFKLTKFDANLDERLKIVSAKVFISKEKYMVDDLIDVSIHYKENIITKSDEEILRSLEHVKGMSDVRKIEMVKKANQTTTIIKRKANVSNTKLIADVNMNAFQKLNAIDWADSEDD